MIIAQDLCKTYKKRKASGEIGKIKALENVNYQLDHGKVYSIVGESGSGKSTFVRIICGLENYDSGSISYKGEEVKNKQFYLKKDVRKNVQLVQQDAFSALNPKISIYKSILEPIGNFSKLNVSDENARVKELMSLVELHESLLHRKPSQLSGGQQKRVNIARAIACNPELLIFDEATTGLDVVVKRKILNLLKKIQTDIKCSYLFVTHDIEVAIYMSDNISVMEKGKIVEQVDFEGDLSCFTHTYSKELIESTFLERNNC